MKPSSRIAEELGLTPRAINYRLEMLVRERAFLVAPVLDMKHVAGTILYGLLFRIGDDVDARRRYAIVERLTQEFRKDSFCRMVNPGSGNVMFMMFTDRIAEPEENYLKAKAIEGVRDIHMDFIVGTHDCSAQVDAWLDEQAGAQKRKSEPEISA